MASYERLARFYDGMEGDRPATVSLIRRLIREHGPASRSVLELGCGTGTILRGLPEELVLHGLDASEPMLEIARKKVPRASLHLGDMSRFALELGFDVILCIFNSINHMTAASQWQSFFEHAHRHLNPGGILIFDINTPCMMEELSRSPVRVASFDGHLMLTMVHKLDEHLYDWPIYVLERTGDGRSVVHEERIIEASFPVEEVKGMLERSFTLEAMMDASGGDLSEASHTVVFVGRKRPYEPRAGTE